MTFGLTDSGFNKKTLTDVLAEIEANVKATLGDVNQNPDSTIGQYNGIIAEVVSDLWDLADLVYNSQYALFAKGVSLDAVAELNNLSRLPATPSTATVILQGTEFTVVPTGTQFRKNNTDEIFELTGPVDILSTKVLKAVYSVNAVATTPHTITIEIPSVSVTVYTNNITTNENDILVDLRDQINGANIHIAEVVNDTLVITNNDLSDITTFKVTQSASMDLDEIWSPGSVECTTDGPITVPANSIQIINSPVSGLDQVNNLSQGTEGRTTESDDDFRLRRKQSIRVVGGATVPSIEARLVQEIEAVSSATVKDNRTDVTDIDGRPPHSFEAIVTFSRTPQRYGNK
ncbi:MAG: hypothetical protein HC773_05155 [Scytonema sp. CRU_2_7]|nr:hypothetical protein [Scytonema sp. CRU_2_7]